MSTPPFVDAPDGVAVVLPPAAPGPVLLARPTGRVRGNALLVPGFTGSKEDFIAVLAPLARLGWQVAAMDLPGQNAAPPLGGRGANSVAALAGAVQEVMAWLGQGSAAGMHLVGHSAGGLVAAAVLLGTPATMTTWSALCSGPGALPSSAHGPLIGLVAALGHEPMERIWAHKRRLDLASGPAPAPRVAKFLERRFLTTDRDALADLALALTDTPDRTAELAAALARPGAPVAHVITGSLDDAWPVHAQQRFAAALPASFHLLHGVGHSPAAQAPATTVRVLDRIWSVAREPAAPADLPVGRQIVSGAGVTVTSPGNDCDMALHATLECDRLAPRTARRAVCEFLADQNLDSLSDDAALLTSELVTNAVRHASGPIHIDAYVRQTRVRLEVADDNADRGPAPRAAGTTDENGRGMELVEKLAARWGWRTVGARKIVWLELAI